MEILYTKEEIGCLAFILSILGISLFLIIINLILTKLIIWFSLGVFNYDLSDKFLYIFVSLTFILPMLKGIFSINGKGWK